MLAMQLFLNLFVSFLLCIGQEDSVIINLSVEAACLNLIFNFAIHYVLY